jgi:hypothetical protein
MNVMHVPLAGRPAPVASGSGPEPCAHFDRMQNVENPTPVTFPPSMVSTFHYHTRDPSLKSSEIAICMVLYVAIFGADALRPETSLAARPWNLVSLDEQVR